MRRAHFNLQGSTSRLSAVSHTKLFAVNAANYNAGGDPALATESYISSGA